MWWSWAGVRRGSLRRFSRLAAGGGACASTAHKRSERRSSSASRSGARVVLVDSAKKIGAKILISGGGRCNVTHHEVTANDFNGNRNAIAKVLRTFDVPQTVSFFDSIGVTLKREETGKLFPTTDRAATVL